MKTAYEFEQSILRKQHHLKEGEILIKFTKSHFDQAIKELEEKQQDYNIGSWTYETYDRIIQTLKDYKPKIK